MPPRTTSTDTDPPSMQKCWPCRRRRLKCDGTLPRCRKCDDNGTECTYAKPLTWVNGVASRGRMMNTTFDEAFSHQQHPATSPAAPPAAPRIPGKTPPRLPCPVDRRRVSRDVDATPALSWALTDPVFQDLGHNARSLLDYCKLNCHLSHRPACLRPHGPSLSECS